MKPDGDRDGPLIVAYVRRELSEAERIAFEQRLATEPDLAAEFRSYVELDLAAEFLQANRGDAAQHRLASRRTAVIVALAASLLVAITVWVWLASRGPRLELELRVVATESVEVLADYAASIGVPDPERVPRDALRSPDPGRPPVEPRTAAEFLDVVDAAEAARSADAFARDPVPAIAEFATLRFRCVAECSALVIELDSNGRLRRRYPSPAGVFVFGELPNRFAAGQTHVLPRPVVVAIADDPNGVSTHPGFDVPSDLPVKAVWWMVAVRDSVVSDAFLTELDGVLADRSERLDLRELTKSDRAALVDTSLDPVEEWLRRRGFACERAAAQTAK